MSIDPDDPWLFERVGLDWRWVTWREAAARIEALSGVFTGLESGSGVAFDGRPSVASVLAACALLGAGLTSMPAGPDGIRSTANDRDGPGAWLPLTASETEIGVGGARLDVPDGALLAAPQLHATRNRGAAAFPAVVDLAGLPESAG